MACKMCKERGQTRPGDPPVCAFEEGQAFDDNFRCATLGALREIIINEDDRPVAHSRPVHLQCLESDEKYAVLRVENIPGIPDETIALFVGWYKSRGRTQALWLMSVFADPRRPTESECVAIINYYNERKSS